MSGREPNTLTMFAKPLQYYTITICTTDANRPEKKDQVLKPYVYCMAKLSIKHLFISCGK